MMTSKRGLRRKTATGSRLRGNDDPENLPARQRGSAPRDQICILGSVFSAFLTGFILLSGGVVFAANTNVCVSMSSSGQVAGVKMNLAWDGSCMSPIIRSGNAAACTAERATGKDVHSAVHGTMMTVLLLSFSDSSPIPDGNLFCCVFDSSAPPSNPCCSLSTAGVGLSDPSGQALGEADAVLQVSVGGAPCSTAAVTGSQGSRAGGVPPPPGYNAAPAAPPLAVEIPAPGAGRGSAPAGSFGQAPRPGGNAEAPEPAGEGSVQATATPPERETPAQPTATAALSATVRRQTSPARTATATAPAQTPTVGEPTPTPKRHKAK